MRRWYVLAVGLMITAGLCVAAIHLVPVRYSVSASVLLLPPESAVAEGSNPYLGLGGLAAPTEILARAMSDRESLEELAKAGAFGEITVERDYTSSAPLLLVPVEDETRSAASDTLDLVLSRIPQTMTELQSNAGVPKGSHIRTDVVSSDHSGERVRKPQIRALVVAAGGGLGLAFLATALLDSLLLSRSRRRTGAVGRHEASTESASEVAPSRSPAMLFEGNVLESPGGDEEETVSLTRSRA
jgi:hypothetical protein